MQRKIPEQHIYSIEEQKAAIFLHCHVLTSGDFTDLEITALQVSNYLIRNIRRHPVSVDFWPHHTPYSHCNLVKSGSIVSLTLFASER
ncbi:Sodium Channel Protein Type 9 Subunit Alpha [Manis pentadactyla]|nr:Sodium Channel Protein Type 9 Subunit Alpha [Manis pentadactyla]